MTTVPKVGEVLQDENGRYFVCKIIPSNHHDEVLLDRLSNSRLVRFIQLIILRLRHT